MRTIKWCLILLIAPVLVSCGDAASAPNSTIANSASMANHQAPGAVASGFKQIVLPHDEPDFPYGEGRELFMARCTVCHSLRYVSMQPDFPAKTWGKEVDKMIKTYGAHITEAEAKQISHYLGTIKGTTPKDTVPKAPSIKDAGPNDSSIRDAGTKAPSTKDAAKDSSTRGPSTKDAGANLPTQNGNGAASSK